MNLLDSLFGNPIDNAVSDLTKAAKKLAVIAESRMAQAMALEAQSKALQADSNRAGRIRVKLDELLA